MKRSRVALASLLAGVAALASLAGGVRAQAKNAHAKLSADQARAAALKKFPGTVEGKIVLENEEGSWQYAVNVRSGKTLREVMVDARTGKIANVEVTTMAEETKEAKVEAAQIKKTDRRTHPAAGKH